jgi:hypothetical protein
MSRNNPLNGLPMERQLRDVPLPVPVQGELGGRASCNMEPCGHKMNPETDEATAMNSWLCFLSLCPNGLSIRPHQGPGRLRANWSQSHTL